MESYLSIKITLKDQHTGEILVKDAMYVKEYLYEFITTLDKQNESNIGNLDCYLVYTIEMGQEVLYQWNTDWILDVEQYLGNGTLTKRISLTRLRKKPKNYGYLAQVVMSNYTYSINKKIAAKLKKDKLYADYNGGNFSGYVWWDPTQSDWLCEVWKEQKHVETLQAPSLPELMLEVSERFE